MAVNARLEGGGYREREGLTGFNSSVLQSASACIKSLFDLPIASPLKIWIVQDGCAGISATAGSSIGSLDPEQKPEFQPMYYYSSSTAFPALGEYNDYIHFVLDTDLKRINLITQPWGTSALTVGGAGTDTPLKTYSGFTGRCLREFNSTLFVGLDAGAGSSKISSWDGTTHRDDRTGLQIPACMADYRIQDGGDALAVGYSTGNLVSLRNTSGTWSDIAPGAGTVTANRMISYKDVLWMTNGDENLFKLDGGTLTRVQPATTGIAAGSITRGIAVINSTMYFMYTTSGAAVRIGSFDGTTWTATVKDLTVQSAAVNAGRDLVAYRGYLVAAANRTSLGARLFVADQSALTGAWTEIIPDASTNGDIDQLLVA